MRRLTSQGLVALLCVELLALNLVACAGHRATLPAVQPVAGVFEPLQEELKKSYLTLFETASKLEYSDTQIARMHEYLKQAQDYCTGRFEISAKDSQRTAEEAQRALKKNNVTSEERHTLHCRIQDARALKSQADVISQHAIPVAYENRRAKLDLIQKWPAQAKQIRASIQDGAYKSRRWADVEDIGFREIEPNQKDDIKLGQEAIRELKQIQMIPKELDDEHVAAYVKRLAQRVGAASDLQVPLQVTVLNSKEINAFALPGGYLFVERGMLEAVEDESQLAGVIAHEIGHVTARHGRKLMRKATIASIVYQAAQVAAVLVTGGMGLGTYYALQYSFYGLGLALNLNLLGVSREFEQQADQLGIQYAWKAGYDTSGFIRFFDKMATREGYVNGVSWFRSHPPFYERMVESEREILYLGQPASAIVDSTDFQKMKDALVPVTRKAIEEEKETAREKPSLLTREETCPASPKLVFEPDQPIETICASPQSKPASQRASR